MLRDILGQPSTIAALQRGILNDHLSQTYLFVGEHQTGKTTTALGLAKVLLCENRSSTEADSCDRCAQCRAVDAGTNADVRRISPTGPSRTLRIPQIWPRDGVKDHPADKAMLRDLHFGPVSGKKRVFIIEAAESMNEDTANSLLKVLEEPPAYALFILTAISTQSVLPTILSRSQTLRFKPVSESAIADHLIQRNVPLDQSKILAAYAQGRPGAAIRAGLSGGIIEGRSEVVDTAQASSSGMPLISAFKLAEDLRRAVTKLADLAGKDEESSQRTLLTHGCDMLLLWYRDLLVSKTTTAQGRVLNLDRVETLNKHASRYRSDELSHAIALIEDCRRYIGRNANPQVTTEYLMLNLVALGARSH